VIFNNTFLQVFLKLRGKKRDREKAKKSTSRRNKPVSVPVVDADLDVSHVKVQLYHC
jgi:hypothetical protein